RWYRVPPGRRSAPPYPIWTSWLPPVAPGGSDHELPHGEPGATVLVDWDGQAAVMAALSSLVSLWFQRTRPAGNRNPERGSAPPAESRKFSDFAPWDADNPWSRDRPPRRAPPRG